jgi:hypothetical protein
MRVSRTCPVCGYTAECATAPLADAHHRRHSCAMHGRGLGKCVTERSDFKSGNASALIRGRSGARSNRASRGGPRPSDGHDGQSARGPELHHSRGLCQALYHRPAEKAA